MRHHCHFVSADYYDKKTKAESHNWFNYVVWIVNNERPGRQGFQLRGQTFFFFFVILLLIGVNGTIEIGLSFVLPQTALELEEKLYFGAPSR